MKFDKIAILILGFMLFANCVALAQKEYWQAKYDKYPKSIPEINYVPGQRSIKLCAKLYGVHYKSESHARWVARNYDAVSIDAGVERVYNIFKEENPNLKIFRYFFITCLSEREKAWGSVGGYDNLKANHPDYFLKDRNGKPFTLREYPHNWVMDITNQGWISYFCTKVIKACEPYDYDAVHGDFAFIDITWYWAPNGVEKGVEKFSDSRAYNRAAEAYYDSIRAQLRPLGLPLILNVTPGRAKQDPNYLINTRIKHCDGYELESFVMRAYMNRKKPYQHPKVVEYQIKGAYEAGRQGKIVILGAQPGINRDQLAYCLGCYLICMEGEEFYLNIDWGPALTSSTLSMGKFADMFNYNFGKPLGKYKQSGSKFTREYTHGTVEVDLERHVFRFEPNADAPKPIPEEFLR